MRPKPPTSSPQIAEPLPTDVERFLCKLAETICNNRRTPTRPANLTQEPPAEPHPHTQKSDLLLTPDLESRVE